MCYILQRDLVLILYIAVNLINYQQIHNMIEGVSVLRINVTYITGFFFIIIDFYTFSHLW